MSGLKIHVRKTEICIFPRRNVVTRKIELNNVKITTSNSINVLGIILDINMKWTKQVEKTLTLWNKNDQEKFQTRRNNKPTNGKILLKIVLWSRNLAYTRTMSNKLVEKRKTTQNLNACISDATSLWILAPAKIRSAASLNEAKKEIKTFISTLPQ